MYINSLIDSNGHLHFRSVMLKYPNQKFGGLLQNGHAPIR